MTDAHACIESRTDNPKAICPPQRLRSWGHTNSSSTWDMQRTWVQQTNLFLDGLKYGIYTYVQ